MILFVVAALSVLAAAADAATPYRFDLARLFFPSPQAEVADRAHLQERIAALRAAGQHLTRSPAELLAALRLADAVRMESSGTRRTSTCGPSSTPSTRRAPTPRA
jgi:hypothetical protein